VVIGGTFFGVFNVNFLAPRQFRQEEIRSFTALAQRAALAIENASLYGQSKELAVYEERQRLARDLHDAVTQTLFSASLMAEVLPKIWDRDQAEGIRRLEELRKLNRGALAEMRTLLLELRPTALVEAELDELLQQLSEAISSRAGVEVDLKVEGSCPMPASAKIAIYRLAQEAFNNIAKHAQASHVEVHLNCSPEDGLALRIKDDGKGFDPERIKMGHLGLGIMKERAEEIGGQFNINSEAGGGTEVTFEWQPEPAEEKYYEREYN
jgi:two-component system nitrate/nitrite sensor histidine kinase NarX